MFGAPYRPPIGNPYLADRSDIITFQNFQSTHLKVGEITINLATGAASLPDDVTPDEAAKRFWDAVSNVIGVQVGKPEQAKSKA